MYLLNILYGSGPVLGVGDSEQDKVSAFMILNILMGRN